MCVIIDREPNVEIDFEKIKAACTVNPDGWGMLVEDRGKVELFREFNEKGNDPEAIAKMLEDSKEQHVALHLRYKTRGSKDLDNCHPFDIFGDEPPYNDDYKLFLTHNGTITGYGTFNDDKSDTYFFGQEYVRPLFARLLEGFEPEEVMSDPFVQMLLEKESGTSSKLLLVDSFGNFLKTNTKEWFEFDGWTASNKYSFNVSHRTASTSTTKSYTTPSYGHNSNNASFQASSKKEDKTKAGKASCVVPWKEPEKRQTFVDLLELESLEEVCLLTDENIDDLVLSNPAFASLLIQDLLCELYDRPIPKENAKVIDLKKEQEFND